MPSEPRTASGDSGPPLVDRHIACRERFDMLLVEVFMPRHSLKALIGGAAIAECDAPCLPRLPQVAEVDTPQSQDALGSGKPQNE